MRALARRALAVDGHPPFSDGALVALAQGRRSVVWAGAGAGLGDTTGAGAEDGVKTGAGLGDTTGAGAGLGDTPGTHARAAVTPNAVGAAIISDDEVELAIDPDARGRGHATRLLEAVLQSARSGLLAWAHGAHPAARTLAARYRFDAVRELLVLRAEVPAGAASAAGADRAPGAAAPHDAEVPDGHSLRAPQPFELGTSRVEGDVRAFDATRDGDEWVALNAKAFAEHPEQGAVSRGDLETLMREPWFEARDFLVLRDDGGTMRGYCWLKVEPADPTTDDTAANDTVGEVYVLGVDPEWQGRGAGRVLLEAGFARLRERGIQKVELYVEADNAPALALYRSAGFTEASRDIQYRWRG